MKKAFLVFLSLLFIISHLVQAGDLRVGATHHEPLPVCLGIVGKKNKELKQVAERIKEDLEFSGQFTVDVRTCGKKASKDEVAAIKQAGYPLLILLNTNQTRDGFEWRLYDTTQANMLDGKSYTKKGTLWRGWAHNIADAIWPVLTGEKSFFSSKLAYCKETHASNGKRLTHVCVADFDGSYEEILIDTPTVNVAPRWNADTKNPLLFYSEYTNSNVRLMAADMRGRRKITSDFEGINMLPAFSNDGTQVIYCASRGNGSCHLYHYTKGSFKKLTNNEGNNIAPCLAEDGKTLFFCSDYETGKPQIYSLDMPTGATKRLTQGGYCASPSFCQKRNQLAYGKIVSGMMQLFLYDFATNTHKQLTKDGGNKEECSWSPCGNYLAYSVEKGEMSRIVILNLLTNQVQYLTDESASRSYPIWSPLYQQYPAVTIS
jgi:TolB protein